MKAITKTVYEAHDGKCFDTPEECRRHERDYSAEMLYDLDEKMIQEALTRSTERGVAIADAIERCAYLIANRRREQGEMRRKRAPKALPIIPHYSDGDGVASTSIDIDNDCDPGAG